MVVPPFTLIINIVTRSSILSSRVFFLSIIITTIIIIINIVIIHMFLLYKFLEEFRLFLGVFLTENCQQVLSTLCHWRLDCLMMMMMMIMMMMILILMMKCTLFEPSELLDSCSEPSSGLFGSPPPPPPTPTSLTFRLFRGRPFSFGAARNSILPWISFA